MMVVGLEVSTSAAKCILFSLPGGVLAEETISFVPDVAGTAAQDPEAMVDMAVEALARVVRRARGPVSAVGLSGTWHSLLLLDAGRQPLGPVMTWADLRSAGLADEIRRDGAFVRSYYQKTGCMVHAMYPIWKWLHLRADESARSAAYLSSQVEFLFERLTGVHKVSKNMASGTGFFNIRTLDWDDGILEFAGLNRSQLGEPAELEDAWPLAKAIAARVGLPSGIPVTVGGADGALTQLGVGGWEEGLVSLSVGTSGAVRMALGEPFLQTEPSLWCYYLTGSKWLAGGATHAGSNLLWVAENMGRGRGLAALESEAANLPASGGPFFLPFLFGERCPGWKENRCGGFWGLRADHTPAHLYRAVLEGVLFNLYQCYTGLEQARPIEAIFASGGISKSPLWLQMAADIFGQTVQVGDYVHDSVIGAALTALKSIGAIKNWHDYQPARTVRFSPRPEQTAIYRERFRRYLELYRMAGEE